MNLSGSQEAFENEEDEDIFFILSGTSRHSRKMKPNQVYQYYIVGVIVLHLANKLNDTLN
jgi:hypothetical protein